MKILFLTLYSCFYPSTRFRIYQYLDYLENDGVGYHVCPALPEEWEMKSRRGKEKEGLSFLPECMEKTKVTYLINSPKVILEEEPGEFLLVNREGS
ncbi:MAG: hypothetical protein GXO71_05985 [Caldiserica bacterium]|nr:hypothetical protein [Caldisericota bacterium]